MTDPDDLWPPTPDTDDRAAAAFGYVPPAWPAAGTAEDHTPTGVGEGDTDG